MADDEQLSSSEEIAQQLSAMNNQWYAELYAGINREKILKQKVVELEEKNNRLVKGVKVMKDQLVAEKDSLRAAYNELIAERDSLKAANDELVSERDSLRASNDELIAEKDGLKAANDELVSERDSLRATNDVLVAEKHSLKAANEMLRKEVKATENEKIVLKNLLAASDSARSKLDVDLAESVEQNFALETQVAGFRNEVKGAEENLRGKQLERTEKHSSKLQVDVRQDQLGTHTGVNKKLQAQLSALRNESHNQMNKSPMKKGAEVEDIKDPLGLPDIPMVTTRGKGAGKAAKVNSAAVVMKSEGEKTAKKRPQRLVARGSPKVGDKIKMSSKGLDTSCEVVAVRSAALKVRNSDGEEWVPFPNANLKMD